MTLREIEREYEPQSGDLGRGLFMSRAEAESLDTTGYVPFRSPASSATHFVVYDSSGSPTSRVWCAFIREENGKRFVAAVVYDSMERAE